MHADQLLLQLIKRSMHLEWLLHVVTVDQELDDVSYLNIWEDILESTVDEICMMI